MPLVPRLILLLGSVAGLAACDRLSAPSTAERVGLLRELVRARTVAGDSVPIDACSVARFMQNAPAWRDSLVAAERTRLVESPSCTITAQSIPGRFVLTQWYRNWSGEYVIRGTVQPWDQGYRFTDGIYVGREVLPDQQPVTGIAERRVRGDTGQSAMRGDSIRRGGALADTVGVSLRGSSRDTTRALRRDTTPALRRDTVRR